MSAVKKSPVGKKKAAAASHPPFADMIKECIVAHPAEARAGVSRPTIKKFLETRYRLDISAGAVTNINRAIAHGAEKGLFVLPKGPSGKVKLAPKARSDAGKENAAPTPVAAKAKVVKKPVAEKKSAGKPAKKTATAGARSKKPATAAKKPSPTKKTATVSAKKTTKLGAKASTKSSTKPAPKAMKPVKKATSTTKKTTKPTATKKTAAKRAPAKKTLTGTSANKPKASTTKTKAPVKKVAAPTKRKAPKKRV